MQTLLCLCVLALFVVHIATAAEFGDEELLRTFSKYSFLYVPYRSTRGYKLV